jgi:hypothetical protein
MTEGAAAGAAAAAAAEAGAAEAPPPKGARRGENTFKLGSHEVTRDALDAAVAGARAEGGAFVWTRLWDKLLPAVSTRPGNVKQIKRAWVRWHPDEEEEEEEEEDEDEAAHEAVAGAQPSEAAAAEATEVRFGLVKVKVDALNAAVASATTTTAGRLMSDWAAAAAAAAPGSGMLPEAAAQLAKEAWEVINKKVGAPTP